MRSLFNPTAVMVRVLLGKKRSPLFVAKMLARRRVGYFDVPQWNSRRSDRKTEFGQLLPAWQRLLVETSFFQSFFVIQRSAVMILLF